MDKYDRVSVKDIANKLNISLSTVNKALTGKGGISEKRRREVIAAAQEMGYVVNSIAQSLSRRLLVIGVIMPSRWPEYFSSMKQGMEAEFERLSKYKVKPEFYYVSSENDDEAENVKNWINVKKVDTVIFCPSFYSVKGSIVGALNTAGIPVFSAGAGYDDPGAVSCIKIDAELSGKMAADFFECINGKNAKTALFVGSMSVDAHRIKAEAFIKRMREYGGSVVKIMETQDDEALAYSQMRELYESGVDLNGIYVATATSLPICEFISSHNMKNKVTLLGTDLFDSLRSYMNNGVIKATIYQNQDELGRIAVRTAYEYLIKTNSYSEEEWVQEKNILVKPSLFLKANIQ